MTFNAIDMVINVDIDNFEKFVRHSFGIRKSDENNQY